MNKLQLYFDYFGEHSGVESWEWYISLKKWVGIAQKIKEEILKENFSQINDADKKTKIEEILTKTSTEIKTVDDFFEQYLFKQKNEIGSSGSGFFWGEIKDAIKQKIDDKLFVSLLTETNIVNINEKLNDLMAVGRCNKVAKIRFLRTLFPDNITACDAEYLLNRLIKIINDKLGIELKSKTVLDCHCELMQYIKSVDYAKKQIFFWELYDMLENNLNLKKAIVYYGAPGTGKTFKAKQIAKQFIDQHKIKVGRTIGEEESSYHIKTVQFHPSYSYEDFIEGIRPSTDGKLSLFNGTFKEFCKKAGSKEIKLYRDNEFLKNFKEKEYDFSQIKVSELSNSQKEILEVPNELAEGITIEEIIEPAFFIIDEINRAELSRVFGELMYSLEYRGYNGKIKTQYAYLNKDKNANSVYFWENGEDWFFIPQNVFIIGTMNNIDRSVDSFDFALRRRFMWEEIEPDYNIITTELRKLEWNNGIVDDLADSLKKLNSAIQEDKLFGKDYRIGHSYILELKKVSKGRYSNKEEVKEFLWKDFIKPLLEEYLRGLGDVQKADEKLKLFKESFGLKEK